MTVACLPSTVAPAAVSYPGMSPVARVLVISRSCAGRSSLPRRRAARNRLTSPPLEISSPDGPATWG